MNLYTSSISSTLDDHHFAFIEVEVENHVMNITLNRPSKKNALHPQMMNEIAFVMHHAHFNPSVWMLTIRAKGNVFCAGADLKAMAGLIEPNDSTIPKPDGDVLIGELFNKIYKPTIAVVTGDVYAGGFFFLAGSNIVIAQDDVKFGLPEVKRGIYPFQVMASLLNVMPPRKVIDWCIRGYNLAVEEALKFGLVSHVVSASDVDRQVQTVIDELKENSPSAIRKGLEAFDHIQPKGSQHQYLYDMLQETLASQDGVEGLKAFREKRKPQWTGQ